MLRNSHNSDSYNPDDRDSTFYASFRMVSFIFVENNCKDLLLLRLKTGKGNGKYIFTDCSIFFRAARDPWELPWQ